MVGGRIHCLAGLDRLQLLAAQHWFPIPILGTAAATACLGAAWLLYLL